MPQTCHGVTRDDWRSRRVTRPSNPMGYRCGGSQEIVYTDKTRVRTHARAARKERENAVTQAVLERRIVETQLNDEDVRLLAHLAAGMTADVAARRLDLSSRTLRRRVRTICDRLDVSTPIQAVVWAAKQGLI